MRNRQTFIMDILLSSTGTRVLDAKTFPMPCGEEPVSKNTVCNLLPCCACVQPRVVFAVLSLCSSQTEMERVCSSSWLKKHRTEPLVCNHQQLPAVTSCSSFMGLQQHWNGSCSMKWPAGILCDSTLVNIWLFNIASVVVWAHLIFCCGASPEYIPSNHYITYTRVSTFFHTF